MKQEPLLRVENLVKHFPVTRGLFSKVVGQVRAVDGVSFEIMPGETLGLVGESGCGKTTVGRALLHLTSPTSGKVYFEGRDISTLSRQELRKLRRDMQIIFQDPFSSLNPRMRVIDIVGESLQVHGVAKGDEMRKRVGELLDRVGVSRSWINRYPHEFSGGQRQRIGVARAIALNPKLIVCDEAVSALDVSIRAQVLNLLISLREQLDLSYLFISHDLSVVRHISDRILVMYLGQIVEQAPSRELFRAQAHPYTHALLSALPVPDPRARIRRVPLEGDVPTPINPPSGCRFHTRCPVAFDRCDKEEPPLYCLPKGRTAACFHAEGLEQAEDWDEQVRTRFEQAAARRPKRKPDVPAQAEPPSTTIEPTEATDEVARLPASVVNAAAAAGVAAGILLVLFGHWAIGLLLSVGLYAPALRKKLPRRALSDGALALVLVAVLIGSAELARFKRVSDARQQISALGAEISDYEKTTGEYPTALSELGYRLLFVFDQAEPLDPWGQPYQYRGSALSAQSGAAPFQLFSFGPDGKKSDDDLTFR